jgi:hypothetical protein
MNTINDKFSFLLAPRFWAMILGAVAIYLKMKNYIGEAEMTLIATITAGFITVKTIDRNLGDKEGVTTVSIPSTVSSVKATTDINKTNE